MRLPRVEVERCVFGIVLSGRLNAIGRLMNVYIQYRDPACKLIRFRRKKGKPDVQFKFICLFDVEYDFYIMRSIAYRSLYLGSRVFVISVGIKLKSRHSFSWCFAR